jgi:hypothetical protein
MSFVYNDFVFLLSLFSFICPDENLAADPSAPVPSLLSILRLVVFEAFLWGLGTAIGELPPYFVARAARLAQDSLNSQTTDGSNDEEEEEEKPPRFPRLHALVEHIKYFIIKTLGRLGFVGIMLFASGKFSLLSMTNYSLLSSQTSTKQIQFSCLCSNC